jgi:hypothetical protein
MVLLRGCDWSPEVTVPTQFVDSGVERHCKTLEYPIPDVAGELTGNGVDIAELYRLAWLRKPAEALE